MVDPHRRQTLEIRRSNEDGKLYALVLGDDEEVHDVAGPFTVEGGEPADLTSWRLLARSVLDDADRWRFGRASREWAESHYWGATVYRTDWEELQAE